MEEYYFKEVLSFFKGGGVHWNVQRSTRKYIEYVYDITHLNIPYFQFGRTAVTESDRHNITLAEIILTWNEFE